MGADKIVTTWICKHCNRINMTFVDDDNRRVYCKECNRTNLLAKKRQCERPRGLWTPEVRQRLIRIAKAG